MPATILIKLCFSTQFLENFIQCQFFAIFSADFQVAFIFERVFDILEQVFLIHASRCVNMGVNFSTVIEIAMWALLLCFFLLK